MSEFCLSVTYSPAKALVLFQELHKLVVDAWHQYKKKIKRYCYER